MYFLTPVTYQQPKNDPGSQVFENCYSIRDFYLEKKFQQCLEVGILGSSYILPFQRKVAFSYRMVLNILWVWFLMNFIFVQIKECNTFALN